MALRAGRGATKYSSSANGRERKTKNGEENPIAVSSVRRGRAYVSRGRGAKRKPHSAAFSLVVALHGKHQIGSAEVARGILDAEHQHVRAGRQQFALEAEGLGLGVEQPVARGHVRPLAAVQGERGAR